MNKKERRRLKWLDHLRHNTICRWPDMVQRYLLESSQAKLKSGNEVNLTGLFGKFIRQATAHHAKCATHRLKNDEQGENLASVVSQAWRLKTSKCNSFTTV